MKTRFPTSKVSCSAAAAAAATLAPSMTASPVIFIPGTPPTAAVTMFSNSTKLTPIDLNNDAVPDFNLRLAHSHSFDSVFSSHKFAGTASLVPLAGNKVLAAGKQAVRQTAGVSFSVKGTFASNNGRLARGQLTYSSSFGSPILRSGNWPGGANLGDTAGYAGVQFDIAGSPHNGWIKLSVQNDPNGIPIGVQAIMWAYESEPGKPLHVTSLAVPEPSTNAAGLGALALGAAGIQALRSRRKQQARS